MSLPYKGILYESSYLHQGQAPTGEGRKVPCMDMELNSMECLEAYGLSKGRLMCAKYLDDVRECREGNIRNIRLFLMKKERFKKIAKGELSWKDRLGKPYEYDSYISGVFFP